MSQRQISPPLSPRPRSKRTVVKSQRAKESDIYIPGIDSTRRTMLTPAPSPGASHDDAARPISPSIVPSQASSQTEVKRPRVKYIRKKKKSTGIRGVNLRQPVKVSTADDSHHTPPTASPQAAAPPQITADLQREVQRRCANYLRYMTISIYPWPHQQPETLADITAATRQWRDKQDIKEASEDIDEDLDDWYVKSGNQEAYSTTHPRFSLHYSIIGSFIMRAKRAYWRGSTWEEFEDSEIAIDSMSEVRKIRDDRIRAIHEKEAVNNDLRLGLFSQIRPRLCFEIWLQEYPVGHRPLVRGLSGHVELGVTREREDGELEVVVAQPSENMTEAAREERQPGKEENHPGRSVVKEATPHMSELSTIAVIASQAMGNGFSHPPGSSPVPDSAQQPPIPNSLLSQPAQFNLMFEDNSRRFRQ